MKALQRMQPQPWIKTRVRQLGKTLKGLGDAMGGLDSARVTEIMAGTRRVRADEIEPMAAYLDMQYNDVYSRLFGSVPSVAGEARGSRVARAGQEEVDLRIHPARDLGGGVFELSADTAGLAFTTSEFVPQPFNCYVTTTVMSPAYEEGDDLRINPTLPVSIGNDVLFVATRTDNQPARAMLRRLEGKTDSHWIVKQWNPAKTEKLDRKIWSALRVEGVKRRG